MLRTLNLWTTMAAKSLRSIPGCFESRAQRFEGLSIMARNGQEATASRSRGPTGKLMRGSEKNGRARGPARTTPGATRLKAAVAATAAEVTRNLRRERWGISTPLLDGRETRSQAENIPHPARPLLGVFAFPIRAACLIMRAS